MVLGIIVKMSNLSDKHKGHMTSLKYKKHIFPQFLPKVYTLFYPCGMKEHHGYKTQQFQYSRDSDDSENV